MAASVILDCGFERLYLGTVEPEERYHLGQDVTINDCTYALKAYEYTSSHITLVVKHKEVLAL